MPDPGGEAPAPATPVTEALLRELQEALAPHIQIVKELGAGGMGTVFLGRDPALKRLVAIKVLNPDLASDESSRLRFEREAEAAAAVAHPNVVSIYEVGVLPRSKVSYFVMQFIEGGTLSEEFPQGKPAPVPQARRIIGEVATALAAAHAKGVVHRDIKPANIMIDHDTSRTVVLDFGISAVLQQRRRAAEPRLTAAGTSVGTPTYMSPEQAAAEDVTDKSDVYSLGVVAFELLTGRPPFVDPSSWVVIAAHIKEAPPKVRDLASNVDPELADLVDTCLAKDPKARPAAVDIMRFLLPGTQPILEWPPPGLEQLRGAGRRLIGGLAIAVGLAWLVLATVLLQPSKALACCWNSPRAESLWDALGAATRAVAHFSLVERDILPIWGLILAGCIVAMPFLGVMIWRRGWRLADLLRLARRAGYPWEVALAVAWDRRADTVSLVNGVDMYALLPESGRRRFLRLRAWESGMLAASVLAAAVTPLFWILGFVPHEVPLSGAAFPATEAAFIVLPPLAFLLAAALCARPEAGYRWRARAGRRTARRRGKETVRPELVGVWLEAAKVKPPAKRGAAPRALVAAGAFVAAAVPALAVLLALGAATLATDRITTAREELDNWDAGAAKRSWRALRVAAVQSARLRPVQGLPSADAVVLVPLAFLGVQERRDPVWAGDTALARAYPPDTSKEPWTEDTRITQEVLAAWRALPGPVPDHLIRALAQDTASPMLGLWRAFAHLPPLPPLWYFHAGLPGIESAWRLPSINASTLLLASRRNAAAAALALAAGDRAEALARTRENLAAAWQFRRDPGIGNQWVTGGLLNGALGDLAAIARITGDAELTEEAGRLRAARDSAPFWRREVPGGELLFADAAADSGLKLVADTAFDPATRFRLAAAAVWGFCTSAREIMFGVDPRRRDLLAQARRRLADIPRSGDWVDLYRRELDRWITEPGAFFRATGASVPMAVLVIPASVGLGGFAARLSACLNLGI